MGKEKQKIAELGGGVVIVTALLARQDAQQPEHLAVTKGTSCGLYPPEDSASGIQIGISRRFLQ